MTQLQIKCVQDFCHSDESLRINSNSHHIVDVDLPNGDVEKHVGRVWSVLTINEHYELFKKSITVSQYRFMYEDEGFVCPGRTFFHQNKCKCNRKPSTQSCVDLIFSSMQHYMRDLDNFLRANCMFKQQLYCCTCGNHDWEKLLGGTVENFVQATCCAKQKRDHLRCGVGEGAKDPLFFQWKCVRRECEECGVEKMLGITKCPIWNECRLETDVLEWVHAA